MEFLKLKIFDVITEKLAVSEFENWLYNSEEFMNKINRNNFYFQVVAINYKLDDWPQKIYNLVKTEYDEETIKILSIEHACLKILQSKTADDIYQHIAPFLENIDYNSEYTIELRFFDLDLNYNSFQKNMLNPIGFINEAKFYANQVVENLKTCNSLSENKDALKRPLEYPNSYKYKEYLSLKQRIFAFFKKI